MKMGEESDLKNKLFLCLNHGNGRGNLDVSVVIHEPEGTKSGIDKSTPLHCSYSYTMPARSYGNPKPYRGRLALPYADRQRVAGEVRKGDLLAIQGDLYKVNTFNPDQLIDRPNQKFYFEPAIL